MTAYDAYCTASLLAAEGATDSDAVTGADIDQAADLADVDRPESREDRHVVRIALDAITDD